MYAATLSPVTVAEGSDAPILISGTISVPTVVFFQVSRCDASILYTNQIGPVVGLYSVAIPSIGLQAGTYSVLVDEPSDSAVFILSFVVIQAG